MAKSHLQQGTKVYFMTSYPLQLPVEMGWLREFSRKWPQVHFSLYQKKPERFTLSELFHTFHRTNHIKVLLTYSQNNPAHNSAIIGGRNHSEMYFYPERPDNSKYPSITQWGDGPLYQWVYFDDLDFEIQNTKFVKLLAQSLMAFNEEDLGGIKKPAQNEGLSSASKMSYHISYPFGSTAHELETTFVQLIDRARKSVTIVSPYINLTKPIRQSMDRARQRGVQFQIISNINVEGDFMQAFSTIRKFPSTLMTPKSFKNLIAKWRS